MECAASKPETPGAVVQGTNVLHCVLSAKYYNTSSSREVSFADFLKEKVNTVKKSTLRTLCAEGQLLQKCHGTEENPHSEFPTTRSEIKRKGGDP